MNHRPSINQGSRGARWKIVSGGQTGADRAALDWAIAQGLPHGGWCPTGRRAEDGVIPSRYALQEVPDGGSYRQRTKRNVLDSDATLIVSIAAELTGGSKLTQAFAQRHGRPWLHVWPSAHWQADLQTWLDGRGGRIEVLNVAGPRASSEPGVTRFVQEVLDEVLANWNLMSS